MPDWFDYVFTYEGDNYGLKGFLDAIELVMQTGFALAAFIAIFLNLFLKEEIEEEDVEVVPAVGGGEGDGESTVEGSTVEGDLEKGERVKAKGI